MNKYDHLHNRAEIPEDERLKISEASQIMKEAKERFSKDEFFKLCDIATGDAKPEDLPGVSESDIEHYSKAILVVHEAYHKFGARAVNIAISEVGADNNPAEDVEDDNKEPATKPEDKTQSEAEPGNKAEDEPEDPGTESEKRQRLRLKPDKPDNKYRLKPDKPDNKYHLKPTPPEPPVPSGAVEPGVEPEDPTETRIAPAPAPELPETPPMTAPTEPKGELPLPEIKDSFKNDIPLEEFDPLTVGVVNQDKDLEAKAIYVGESRLAEEINDGKGFFRKLAKKIFKGGIAKNYYRQKYINEARRDMRLAQNIVLDYDEKERRRFNRGVCKTFLSEEEGVIDEQAGDSRKSLQEEFPEMHAKIQDIVARYASGEIKSTEEASREFKQIIRDLESGSYSGENGHISVSNITDIAIEAKRRYDALMTISESMNGKLEHDEAIARVMAGFDVKYGERRMDRLDPHYNKVDKIVNKIQMSKLGPLVSPETTALAVGAAACVVETFGRRVPTLIFGTVPGLSGAIAGGMRASADFEKEHSRALYDERYSREFDGNQKERERMMKTLHEHHSAKEVSNDLASRIDAINEARAKGTDTAGMYKELLQAVARCKAYLDFDKTEHSVLSYSSEVEAPEEQLRLLQQMGAAKRLLRETGANIDKALNDSSALMTNTVDSINNNLKESEKLKRKAKVARIAKRAGVGLAAGVVTFVGMQEVRALFDDNVQGIFESGNGNYGARLTATKKLALALTGKDKMTPDMKSNFDIASGNLTENSKELNFVQAKDGTYSLVDAKGKTIANGLDWNAKTGEMTPASIKTLEAQGIKVSSPDKLTQMISKDVRTTSTRNVSIKEYFENTTDKTPNVHREYWYDNNTSAFDQNELRCYYHTDTDGNHGLITGMFDNGSYHGDKVAQFSALAKNGSIKLMISPTEATQGTPIQVTGELLPNGQISFCPEPGTAAASFFDADGKFIGKYAEIVQDLGTNSNGEMMIAPLSTVVGEGYDGNLPIIEEIVETVKTPVDVPEYLFQFPGNEWNMPFIMPFSAAGAMNASKHAEVPERSKTEMNFQGYGYGYGGYSAESSPEKLGEVSPRIAEGKKLNLGTELSWYIDDQLQSKSEKEYIDSVKREAEKSPVLKTIDNKVKTIVTIPVHAPTESENIYRTLSLYSQQEGIDHESLVILLDVNWRGDREKGDPAEVAQKIQATRDRIEQAKRDFPNLKIATMEQSDHTGIHEVAREMNDVVMYALNSAVKSGKMSADNDVLVIRNDADMKHMGKNYVASYQKAANDNPKTPLFTGSSWFDINRQSAAPGFAATQVIERVNNMFGAFNGEIHTEGRNFAYRASHFAAMNGYGFASDGATGWTGAASDDLRVGWRMEDAFREAYINRVDGSTDAGNDELMDPATQMLVRVGGAVVDTDDNRQLRFYEAGLEHRADVVTDDAYGDTFGGYNANAIRPEAITNFVEDLTDRQRYNDITEQFEREMSRFFTRSGDKRSPRYRNIMSWFLGVPVGELDRYFSVEDDTGRGNYFRFTLSDDGKQRLREALVARFGDGLSTDVRNSLQEAVASGKWVAPAANPTA